MQTQIENTVFNSLENYLDDIYSRLQTSPFSLETLFKIREEGRYSIFFMCSEPLEEILVSPNSEANLALLKDEGFFLLTPVKTNVAIGKGYEVSYCRDDERIISKNLATYGYVFIAPTSALTKVEDGLILCEVPESHVTTIPIGSKKLVELFPRLYLFFNVKASRQILIMDLKN